MEIEWSHGSFSEPCVGANGIAGLEPGGLSDRIGRLDQFFQESHQVLKQRALIAVGIGIHGL